MRFPVRAFLLVLVVVPAVFAAPVPKARQQKSDQDQIVGRWKQVYPQGSQSVWVFQADGSATIEHGPKNTVKAHFTLDPNQNPKHFNWALSGTNSRFVGLYELNGDKFTFVVSRSGLPQRPAEIKREQPSGECYEFEKISD
jgi:uncharacterized protein (TIGR03067 family)